MISRLDKRPIDAWIKNLTGLSLQNRLNKRQASRKHLSNLLQIILRIDLIFILGQGFWDRWEPWGVWISLACTKLAREYVSFKTKSLLRSHSAWAGHLKRLASISEEVHPLSCSLFSGNKHTHRPWLDWQIVASEGRGCRYVKTNPARWDNWNWAEVWSELHFPVSKCITKCNSHNPTLIE